MSFILTWEDNLDWDDVVPFERRELLDKLIEENKGKENCPHLRQLGKRFPYCSARAVLSDHLKFTEKPSLDSAQYHAQIDHFELQIWCMQPEECYHKCINFQEAKGKIIDG